MSDVPTAPESALVIQMIPLDQIRPSPHQVRKDFEEAGIRSLAESIDKEGLIQPITVRRVPDGFELIAGERRWRAAKLLAREAIESRIVDVPSEAAASAKGLIENVQRQDLNPVEEAEGFAAINKLDPGYWTKEKIGQIAGKDRSFISKSISMLELPKEVLDSVRQRTLARELAIELMRIDNGNSQKFMARKIIKGGWSLKQARAAIDSKLAGKQAPKMAAEVADVDPLAGLESLAFSNGSLGPTGAWEITYKSGRWLISIENRFDPPQEGLADFLTKLADAIRDGVPRKKNSAVSNTELGDPKESEHPIRLPKTAEEEAELARLAVSGPTAAYSWIYGPGNNLTRLVAGKTWQELGCADSKAGLALLVAGVKNFIGD